jgi:hypothetical protein
MIYEIWYDMHRVKHARTKFELQIQNYLKDTKLTKQDRKRQNR